MEFDGGVRPAVCTSDGQCRAGEHLAEKTDLEPFENDAGLKFGAVVDAEVGATQANALGYGVLGHVGVLANERLSRRFALRLVLGLVGEEAGYGTMDRVQSLNGALDLEARLNLFAGFAVGLGGRAELGFRSGGTTPDPLLGARLIVASIRLGKARAIELNLSASYQWSSALSFFGGGFGLAFLYV